MAEAETFAPRRRFQIIRRLVRHRSFRVGFTIVVVLAVAALFAPWITSLDPTAMRARARPS